MLLKASRPRFTITLAATLFTLTAVHLLRSTPLAQLEQISNTTSWGDYTDWLSWDTGTDRLEEAERIRGLRDTFQERFPRPPYEPAPARGMNTPALDRLATCIESDSCGPGEETVVILASFHFNNALGGRTSGEDIWAMSIMESLHALNYTLLYAFGPMDTLTLYQGLASRVALVIWEYTELQRCLHRNETSWEELETPLSRGTYQQDEGRFGCIRREGYEDGVPLEKSFTLHFWEDARHPLGRRFTLAPEDYQSWNGGVGNHYLGYSVESRCRSQSFSGDKFHRGLILGKNKYYFDPSYDGFAWPGLLAPAVDAMPPCHNSTSGKDMPFELIATGGKVPEEGEGPEVLFEQRIRNLGPQKQEEWNKILAGSKFMLGIGRPYLSPSPYDALCFGVPFINPITFWDPSAPDDHTQWHAQHMALRPIGQPYVYHVRKDDEVGLKEAFEAALANPIKSFIPPEMTKESVRERTRVLVETDWMARAEAAVKELYTDPGEEFPWLL
ncbi:hypothetical protein IAT38_001237 [Cryptococcus sp. DSM 104549]